MNQSNTPRRHRQATTLFGKLVRSIAREMLGPEVDHRVRQQDRLRRIHASYCERFGVDEAWGQPREDADISSVREAVAGELLKEDAHDRDRDLFVYLRRRAAKLAPLMMGPHLRALYCEEDLIQDAMVAMLKGPPIQFLTLPALDSYLRKHLEFRIRDELKARRALKRDSSKERHLEEGDLEDGFADPVFAAFARELAADLEERAQTRRDVGTSSRTRQRRMRELEVRARRKLGLQKRPERRARQSDGRANDEGRQNHPSGAGRMTELVET